MEMYIFVGTIEWVNEKKILLYAWRAFSYLLMHPWADTLFGCYSLCRGADHTLSY